MSSSRFPGKSLAPFRGQPIVAHVLRAVGDVLPPGDVVLVTSDEPSDDPLAWYVERLGYPVFRGSRDDVFARFRAAARQFPSQWILRVCADSPLLDPGVIRALLAADRNGDVITTTHPRSFPSGQNAELVRASTFMALADRELSAEDREHVTAYFYRHADRFAIRNLDSRDAHDRDRSFVVDTLDDLRRLEALLPADDWRAAP